MSAVERMRQVWARQALRTGWSRFDSVKVKLPSGRVFEYKLTDYPFRALAPDEQIDALCCQLIKDKYRYCEWDRAHPKTNAEVEIFDALKKFITSQVEIARHVQAEMDTAGRAEPGSVLSSGDS